MIDTSAPEITTLPELPPAQENMLNIEDTVAIAKMRCRIDAGKKPAVLANDIDGTLYTVYQKETSGQSQWEKAGDNSETSRLRRETHITDIVISGRPDYSAETDLELQKFGYDASDIPITAAGTIVYWRMSDGSLILDEEYVDRMRNQPIEVRTKDSSDPEGKRIIKTAATYDKDLVQETIQNNIAAKFLDQGLTRVKTETNQGIGFTVLDLDNMPIKELQRLVAEIKSTIRGVKVELAEDIKRLGEGTFSGWMQVVPVSGGKDGALRYVMEKLAGSINPGNDPSKKPTAYTVGDSSIDIWMLAAGSNAKDHFAIEGFGLANLTPEARRKLSPVVEVLALDDENKIIGQMKQEEAGEVKNIVREERAIIAGGLPVEAISAAAQAMSDAREQIRAIHKDTRRREQRGRDWKRAHLTIIDKSGPEGVLEVAKRIG